MFKQIGKWLQEKVINPFSRIFRSKRDVMLAEIERILPQLTEAALDSLITFILLNLDALSGRYPAHILSQHLKAARSVDRREALVDGLRNCPDALLEDARAYAEKLLHSKDGAA